MKAKNRKTIHFFLFLIIITIFISSTDVIPEGLNTIVRITFYISCIGFILLNFKLVNNVNKIFSLTLQVYIWYLAFFLGSALLSSSKIHGLWIFVNTGLLSVLFIISSFVYFKKYDRVFFIKCCFYGSFMIMILSCILIFSGIEVHYYGKEEALDVSAEVLGYKFSGLYRNQNKFGLLLGVVMILTTYLMTQKTIYINRVLLWISILLSVVLIFLTMSRGAILYAFVAMGGYFLLLPKDKRIMSMVFMVFLGAFLFFQLFDTAPLIERFTEGTMTGRDAIWEDALQKGKENIFFGVGPNEYRYIRGGGTELTAHNFYINNFVNLGLPAIFFYILGGLIVVLYGVYRFRKLKENERGEKRLLAFSIAYLIALYLNQLFESTALNPGHFAGFIAMFLMGLILSLSNAKNILS